MIETFEIENLTTKNKISFGQNFDYDFLVTEMDWGSAQANHSTYAYPDQVGSYIVSTSIKERDIALVGFVYSLDTFQDEKSFGYQKMIDNKRILGDLINPLNQVKITIGDYYIVGKPSNPIIFGNIENENNNYFCKFRIDIFCDNPMFKKNSIVQTVTSESEGNLMFPLVINGSGIYLSSREEYELLTIENEGNKAIGGIITIKSKGEVINPTIENVNTGEKFTILKTLERGEEIKVSTLEGNERSIVGKTSGDFENYFKYWKTGNDWISFGIGTTILSCTSDNMAESLLEVLVEINPEKYILEEM